MLYLAHHYAEAACTDDPARTAVLCPERGEVSYGELEMQSNQLANCLREAGVSRQDRIAIWHGRTAGYIVALLGTLKADGVYVPIQENALPERARRILTNCRPTAVVCDRARLPKVGAAVQGMSEPPQIAVLDGPPGLKLGNPVRSLLIDPERVVNAAVERHDALNIDTDLAYILYTSGSTGQPKGVMVSHLNIINYIEWAAPYFAITAEDRILNTAPFHFDMSTFDIYATQKVGATLCIAKAEEILFPSRLVDRIDATQVSIWKAVSSLLTYVASAGVLSPHRCRSLRQVIFSGEKLPTKHLIEWMRTYPDCIFYNAYGPTETTGVSACHRIDRIPQNSDEVVPIGRACANSEIRVLRDDGTPARVGEYGELCIRGSCVSAGYWNAPEETKRAFIANPLCDDRRDALYRTGDVGYLGEDGLLYLSGRSDEQVKYQGYRVELGEIAHALQSLPDVRDAAALLLCSPETGKDELVAFVDSSPEGNHASIRSALRRVLPDYMVPRRYIDESPLPRTDRGKLDKKALERIYQEQSRKVDGERAT
jgi:amino acid adenylation domain-containing protein